MTPSPSLSLLCSYSLISIDDGRFYLLHTGRRMTDILGNQQSTRRVTKAIYLYEESYVDPSRSLSASTGV